MKPHNDANGNGVREDEDKELLQALQKGWSELDALTPVFPPSQQLMEQMVEEHRKTMRRRFVRDLALFFTVAFVVLFAVLAAIARVPVVFAALQIAALLAGSVFLTVKQRKQVKEHD